MRQAKEEMRHCSDREKRGRVKEEASLNLIPYTFFWIKIMKRDTSEFMRHRRMIT